MRCPQINSFGWDTIEVDGIFYRDVKIYPDRAETWDWLKTDTRHDPGIRAQDVQDLLDRGCDFIILSSGPNRKLSVDFDTYKLLLKYNVDFLVTDTALAVDRYREEIKEGQYLVGALLHTQG
jgi:hypothetical protein